MRKTVIAFILSIWMIGVTVVDASVSQLKFEQRGSGRGVESSWFVDEVGSADVGARSAAYIGEATQNAEAKVNAAAPHAMDYSKEVLGFWRELGTSIAVDGEVDPSKDYWYFKADGTLATQGTAMFGGDKPFSIAGDKITSASVGGTYTIVTLRADRMVLAGPFGGFWHLERRRFDSSLEHSGRYYSREQIAIVMAETVCIGMRNLGADKNVLAMKLSERLKTLGFSALDEEKLSLSTRYYSDDPEFVLAQPKVLMQTMKSCKKQD